MVETAAERLSNAMSEHMGAAAHGAVKAAFTNGEFKQALTNHTSSALHQYIVDAPKSLGAGK